MMIAGIASMKQPMNRNAAAMMKPTLVMPPPHDGDGVDDELRDVEVGEQPAEGRRGADAEQRDAGEARRIVQRVPAAPASRSVR